MKPQIIAVVICLVAFAPAGNAQAFDPHDLTGS
jgi:hypothetical protein